MFQKKIFGVVTKHEPEVMVVGTDKEKVVGSLDEIDEDKSLMALFCCILTEEGLGMIIITGFEPGDEHYKAIKEFFRGAVEEIKVAGFDLTNLTKLGVAVV